MNITSQDMKYVCSLAKHLHFGRAAVDCNTSQPNLSAQIKKVESELGARLFERNNKFVFLSRKGQEVVATFRTILTQLNDLNFLCHKTEKQTIKVGIFPTLAPYLLPLIMPKLKKTLPMLSLYIVENKTQTIIEQLHNGELDCILAAHPVSKYNFDYQNLFEDPFYLAVSIDNPLSKLSVLTMPDLKDEKVLLLEDGHCLRDHALDICYTDALTVDSSFESSSLETLKAMVSGNIGITFVPKICLDNNPLIQYLPLQKSLSRHIAMYWRKSAVGKENLKNLATIIKKSVASAPSKFKIKKGKT